MEVAMKELVVVSPGYFYSLHRVPQRPCEIAHCVCNRTVCVMI